MHVACFKSRIKLFWNFDFFIDFLLGGCKVKILQIWHFWPIFLDMKGSNWQKLKISKRAQFNFWNILVSLCMSIFSSQVAFSMRRCIYIKNGNTLMGEGSILLTRGYGFMWEGCTVPLLTRKKCIILFMKGSRNFTISEISLSRSALKNFQDHTVYSTP